MNSLIQPSKRLIIWADPFSGKIVLDKLDKNYDIDHTVKVSPYEKLHSGFAYFANENKIEPKGWRIVEGEVTDFKQTFNEDSEPYYGNG